MAKFCASTSSMLKQNALALTDSPAVSKHLACFNVYMSRSTKSDTSAKNLTVSQMWNPAPSIRKTASTLNTPIHGEMNGRGRLRQHSEKRPCGGCKKRPVYPA